MVGVTRAYKALCSLSSRKSLNLQKVCMSKPVSFSVAKQYFEMTAIKDFWIILPCYDVEAKTAFNYIQLFWFEI